MWINNYDSVKFGANTRDQIFLLMQTFFKNMRTKNNPVVSRSNKPTVSYVVSSFVTSLFADEDPVQGLKLIQIQTDFYNSSVLINVVC